MAARVLIITDRLAPSPELFAAVRARVEESPATFRLLATNPARAEFHLVHAEHHVAVERAQAALHGLLDELSLHAGSPVHGEVSIRHDAFQAVEEDVFVRPADEILVAVHERELAHRLHHDLPHRLERLHLPVSVIPSGLVSG